MVRISEVENIFKELFEEEKGKVRSVDTVYELSDDEKFNKLVISLHNLSTEDALIIHTRFIFKVDLNKTHLLDNSYLYLYDINCVYHKENFRNEIELKSKIQDIIKSNKFGQDIVILSDFIEAPAMFLNYYMKRAKITDYSIFDVIYEPKFKHIPCEKITFDFDININDNYDIHLSISKKERSKDEDHDTYKFQFRFLDEYTTIENDTLTNIHYKIGDTIAQMLDKKLK